MLEISGKLSAFLMCLHYVRYLCYHWIIYILIA